MKKNVNKKAIPVKRTLTTKSKAIKNHVTDKEGIREKVLEIVSNLAKLSKEKIEEYTEDDFNDLGLDSFTLVEIVFSLENTFDIDIPQDSLPGIRSFDDLVSLIEELTKKRG